MWILPVVLALVFGAAQLNAFQVGSYHDDAWYIAIATALAKGFGYVRLWTPGLKPETALPVGYPLILAPLRLLFPGTLVPLQLVSLAATLGIVALSAWYYKHRLDWPLAWFATLILAVNASLVGSSILVMSDVVYTFFSMGLIVMVEHQNQVRKPRLTAYLLAGLLATGVYLVRPWGISLVAALILYYAVHRRWQGLAFTAIPFAAVFGFLSVRNAALGGVGASYGIGPSTLLPILVQLTRDLPVKASTQWLRNLPELLVPLFSGPRVIEVLGRFGLAFVVWGIGAALLAIIGIGYWSQCRKRVSLAEFYLPIYAIIVTLAPLTKRYWLPLLPLLVLYLVRGLQSLVSSWPGLAHRRKVGQFLVPSLMIALALVYGFRDIQAVRNPVRNRIPDIALGPKWLAENTAQDAVIMAQTPRVAYLYSDRTVVPFPDGGGEIYEAYPDLADQGSTDRFYAALDKFAVSYILIDPELVSGLPFQWSRYVQEEVIPLLDGNKSRFEMIYSSQGGLTRVYRVAP